ncbi:transcriptional regulator [Rathayibacter sp. AY1E9]|jgi:predicted NBD/HSP70 family sugar kinase|uniref:ROK family protein n=1 Tax=unclassified Rathayibacter TaxID=2609250 RepID=UPI000CE728E4|nr:MULTISPECIES: ROK family protein [unclassified Rathayibacter]PPG52394.1 transcriptional regulator [Rathayibacter sp. AY1E9]PPG60640.1 transcriptional regulator [Rathayibacter sp. AY1C5]PPH41731.1 transcriptional regulator [Rathayibacter sp. AY1E4]
MAGAVGASSNALLRRTNLASLATLVHRSGPTSRAELGRLTGLNRSAVANLVGELSELGWVAEETTAPDGRIGRPSATVVPGDRFAAVGVHLDTDAIIVGLVGLHGELLRRVRFDTPKPASPATVVRVVAGIVEGFRSERESLRTLVGAGVAVPGLVQADSGFVHRAPHLGWRDVDLATQLSRALDLPVAVGNDATLGAIGESLFGAAHGVADVVYVTGGAGGIGGGVIIGGVPLQGSSGFAAELGHTLVATNGRLCGCGRRGCLEAEVRMRSLLDVLGARVLDQDELDIALGTSRDPAVLGEVARQVDLLSEGLSTYINLFNPTAVVLGGFLGSLLTVDRERLAARVSARALSDLARGVRIERAALRSRLELVGAAELPWRRALADPAAVTGGAQPPGGSSSREDALGARA